MGKCGWDQRDSLSEESELWVHRFTMGLRIRIFDSIASSEAPLSLSLFLCFPVSLSFLLFIKRILQQWFVYPSDQLNLSTKYSCKSVSNVCVYARAKAREREREREGWIRYSYSTSNCHCPHIGHRMASPIGPGSRSHWLNSLRKEKERGQWTKCTSLAPPPTQTIQSLSHFHFLLSYQWPRSLVHSWFHKPLTATGSTTKKCTVKDALHVNKNIRKWSFSFSSSLFRTHLLAIVLSSIYNIAIYKLTLMQLFPWVDSFLFFLPQLHWFNCAIFFVWQIHSSKCKDWEVNFWVKMQKKIRICHLANISSTLQFKFTFSILKSLIWKFLWFICTFFASASPRLRFRWLILSLN